MQNNTRKVLLGAAIAGMISGGAMLMSHSALAADKKGDKVDCYGANACKGKSGCAVEGSSSCKGQNACKGKGKLSMTAAKCKKKGGTTEAPKAKDEAPKT